MVGDDDSTDEYTIVSPMRTRLDPLYSGAPAHPLSGGGEYSGNSDIPSESVGSISLAIALVLGPDSNV